MASRGDIEAGRAFVRLFLKDDIAKMLGKALRNASKQLKLFGQSVSSIGKIGLAAFGSASASLALPIKAASDAAETINKFNAVFGDSAESVNAWADQYRNAVGRARRETLDSLSAFQGFFSGLGVGGQEAAEMSKEIHSLSVDFASFHNLTDDESMQRFISALSGSGEVLDRFGVNIKQAALDIALLEMGFPKSTQGATEFQKVMARTKIIREAMGRQGAVGDAVKTADSFTNRLKALRASTIDASEAMGKALIPVIAPLVAKFAQFAKSIAQVFEQNPKLAVTIGKFLVLGAAGSVALIALGKMILVFGGVISGALAVAGAIGAIFSPLGLLAAAVAYGVRLWLKYSESGRNAVNAIAKLISPIVQTFQKAFGGIKAALADGDLGRAAQIAFAGLKLAAVQSFAAVDAIFGDMLAGIGGRLLSGDFSGAWSDTLIHLSLLWATFVEGLTNTFASAANGILNIWQKVTQSITRAILDLASLPGFNVAFKAVSGVDVRAEMARAEKLGMNPEDALNQAKATGAAVIAGQTQGIRDALASMSSEAARATAEAAVASTEAGQAGISALAQAAIDAQSQFDSLLSQSKATAADVAAGGKGGIGPGGMLGAAGAAGAGIRDLTTFSAAAAIASGFQGTSPQQKMAENLASSRKIQEEQKNIALKQLDASLSVARELEQLRAGMMHG